MDCDDHQSSPERSVDSPPKFATELSTCDMNTIEISSPSSFSWASYSYSPSSNQSLSYCLPSPVKRIWSESSPGPSPQKKSAKSPADNHPKVGDLVESIRKNAAVWQPPQTVVDDDATTVSQGNRFDLLDIRAYEDSLRRANEREFNPQKSLDESDFIKQLRAACKNYHSKYSPKKKRIMKDKSYSPYLKTPPSGSFSYIVRPSPRRIFSPRQLWTPERPIYKMHLDQESQTIVSQLVGPSKSGPAAPNSKCGVSLTRPYMNRFLEVPNNAKMDYKPLKSSEGVSVQICGELEVLPRMGSSGVTYGKVRFEPNAMKAVARCTKFARLNVLIGQFGMRIKEQGDDMSDERVIEAGDCFSLASGTKYTITNLTDQEAIIDFTVFI